MIAKKRNNFSRGGKNQFKGQDRFRGIKRANFKYCDCGKKICLRAERCHSCANKHRKGTYNISEIAKKHMSEVNYKRTNSEKAKKATKRFKKTITKIYSSERGDKMRKKRSETMKWIYSIPLGKVRKEKQGKALQKYWKEHPERRIEISKKLMGRKLTDEHKENIRKARIKEYQNGRKPPMEGKSHSIEARRKISEKNKAWNKGLIKQEVEE